METFTAFNPVRLHFGKGICNKLGGTVNHYGKKAMLIYGKGSIKTNGIYNTVVAQLKDNNIEWIEFDGIKSNPIIEDVDKASLFGIKHKVDIIVAVGGGSVIDSAKIISLAIANNAPGWEIMKYKITPTKALPIIAVLTLAATGTEMNSVAVVQNIATQQKLGYSNPLIFPKESFLDPSYTLTVKKNYTAYGISDLVAHCLEAFFGDGDAHLSDRFTASIIQEALEIGPLLINDLENYDYRERIMWAATNALNGLTSQGRANGDWAVHGLGHVISLLFDTPHGASLTIIYPAWLKLHKDRIPQRIAMLGNLIFGKSEVDATIEKLEQFFKDLGCPTRLSEVGIQESEHEKIFEVTKRNRVTGYKNPLDEDDYRKLIELMK